MKMKRTSASTSFLPGRPFLSVMLPEFVEVWFVFPPATNGAASFRRL